MTKKRYVVCDEWDDEMCVLDGDDGLPYIRVTINQFRRWTEAKARRIANEICKQLNEGKLK